MMVAIHIILLVLLAIPSVYYFVFAAAGRIAAKSSYETDGKIYESRFCILIPAYKSDSFIMSTATAAFDQDYPKEKFRVLVISDSMTAETEENLRQAGIEVLHVCFENSTKAASLSAAADYLGPCAAEYAVILDSDNIVEPSFLREMNKALRGRQIAVQGHRCAKNTDTPTALADGIFEEVNNLVFRKGHCALGLSSALIGSGMAFPYGWFVENARGFLTAGEDKEMELKLLEDGIFVEYADSIRILDEKTRSVANLQKQRLRWLTSQYFLFGKALAAFPKAKLKAGYADKIFQWTFLPRLLIVAGLPVVAIITAIAGSAFMPAYAAATILLYSAIILGIPDWVKPADLIAVLKEGPRMAAVIIKNIFCRKPQKDKYIHTDHQ
ncbi:MAG: glycosyltransferase [Candidatus Cryptobacteroides sp.]